jgi:hypothetical protein
MLFIIGTRAVLAKPGSWAKFGLQGWLAAAAKRLHHNVLAAALANKLARIAWIVLYHGRAFAPPTRVCEVIGNGWQMRSCKTEGPAFRPSDRAISCAM